MDIVDKSEKSNVISSEPVSSRSKKNISLALFDASDDDDDDADADNVRKSSKSASAAKPRKVSGSAGLFDSSDDDNPSLLSKRAAGVAKSGRQRRSSDLFDVSDDDEVIAASAVSSTSKRKRRHSDPFDDDEETFFQEKETKRKCLVSAEDSEMTSVAVKQEKEDTHAGIAIFSLTCVSVCVYIKKKSIYLFFILLFKNALAIVLFILLPRAQSNDLYLLTV